MNLMERSFDPTVFTKNRQRLLEHRIGQSLFDQVVVEGRPSEVAVGRAFQRGRNADRVCGEHQELQTAR